MTREDTVRAIKESDGFQTEVRYTERGGYQIGLEPRLYKELEEDLVRVVFPANPCFMEEGAVLAVTTLYDRAKGYNIYGHAIFAGPGVNPLLRNFLAPLGGAHPQAGNAGPKAIQQFVAVKQALWNRFVLEELELGNQAAGEHYVRGFWKALDRMFGGGHLTNVPEDWHWPGE